MSERNAVVEVEEMVAKAIGDEEVNGVVEEISREVAEDEGVAEAGKAGDAPAFDEETFWILSLPVHEAADLLPAMQAEEFVALMDSVVANGVHTPCVLWKDPRDKVWFVDGRNRKAAVKTLYEAGVTTTKSGNPIRLTYIYIEAENEYELLQKLLVLGRDRRHLSASQRAALGVKGEVMNKRYASRHKIARPKGGTSEETATKIARESGVNRSFIYDAQKLYKQARDLFDAVLDGSLKIHTAMAEFRRRMAEVAAGEKDGGEGGEGGEDTRGSDIPNVVVKDGDGNEVAPEFAPVFAVRDQMRQLGRRVRDLVNLATEIRTSVGGAYFDDVGEEVLADLRKISRYAGKMMPHCLCPDCGGAGKVEETDDEGKTKKKKCEKCDRRGYITRDINKKLTGKDGGDGEGDE